MAVEFVIKLLLLLMHVNQVHFQQDFWSYVIHLNAYHPAQKCTAEKHNTELAGTDSYVVVEKKLPEVFWIMKNGTNQEFGICSDTTKNLKKCFISEHGRNLVKHRMYNCKEVKDETELPNNRVVDIHDFSNEHSKLATVTWNLLRIPSGNFIHFEILVCEGACKPHEQTNVTSSKHFTFPVKYSTEYNVFISIAGDKGSSASHKIYRPEDPERWRMDYGWYITVIIVLQSFTLLCLVVLVIIWLIIWWNPIRNLFC